MKTEHLVICSSAHHCTCLIRCSQQGHRCALKLNCEISL